MIKLKDILIENSSSTYDFGCVMLDVNFPLHKIQKFIDIEDVYKEEGDQTYGLEDEPHITLLYGLHDGVSTEQIKKALKDIQFGKCKLHNVSLFQSEKYDVLKFDVGYFLKGNPFLSKANNELKQFPYTSNFPEYHPHMTIGYLKPGTGSKYVKKFKKFEFGTEPTQLTYSHANGIKDTIKI